MKGKTKEIISAIFLYIVSISFFAIALNLKGDAGLFPKILSALIFILNTIELFNVVVRNKIKLVKKEDRDNIKLLTILLCCIGYIILIKPLGFLISTVVFLAVTLKLLGVKELKLILLVSIITSLVIYLSFGVLLKVQIPVGIFGI